MRVGPTALAGGLAVATLVGLVSGAGLPRLPGDRALPRSADSPGVVVFSHRSHLDAARPRCTACHPRVFRMLKPSTPAPGSGEAHRAMEAGQQCGACHNGKDATGLDSCETCHRTE